MASGRIEWEPGAFYSKRRCAMRQSYLKNAALLTGSDVVLRLAGMGLRLSLIHI